MRTKGKDFAVTFEGHRDHARGGDPMIKRSIPAIAKLNLSLVLSLALLAVAAGKAAGADASCPPPAVALTADKTDINVGESVSVSWSAPAGLPLPLFVPNHYTWSGSRELAAHSGNRTVTGFSAPGSYYIAIRSTDTCFETYPVSMLTIKVHALPNVYFSPSTAYPNTGNSVTLSWNCTANCEGGVAASAGLGGSPGLSGTIYPSRASDGSESYSLTVKNAAGGQRTANAWIQWSTPQPDYGDMDCFASGTQITMADGGKKNVEDLQVGDAVRSYDAKTGKFTTVKVLSAATKAGGDYVKINGGKGVTLDHRIFANGEWKRAGDLKVGDELVDEAGNLVKITAIENKPGPVTVHPIKVEDPPSTFIAEGIVVHNRDEAAARNEGLLSGTKVTMADGTRVPIEKVKAGDKLLSIDPKTGMLKGYLVRSTAVETASKYTIINGTLRMGGSHRLLRAGAGKAKRGRRKE